MSNIKNISPNLLDKITEGFNASFKNLVKTKSLTNGELIFSENGKIVTVKAREMSKYLKNKSK
jgi:ribosomal protein S17E